MAMPTWRKKIPIVADKTLFRVASPKLVTATAATQLYSRNGSELDAPVNKYPCEFPTKSPYPEPARVAQLMTHTDGTTIRQLRI